MSEIPHGPEDYELSTDQAREVVELQRAICEELFQKEITSVTEVPVEMIEEVRLHVITCGENHYSISGLIIEDE